MTHKTGPDSTAAREDHPTLRTWPDTTSTPPPADHPYASALWLLGRHPRLARLARRIPGCVARDDDDGRLSIDMDVLSSAILGQQEYGAAWELYERRNPPPADTDSRAYDVWEQAGPKPPGPVAAYGPMSTYEQKTLRLFAVLNQDARVPLYVDDFQGGDDEFRRYVRDLLEALAAA